MSFLTNFHGQPYITEIVCVPNDHPAFEIENGLALFGNFERVIYLNTSNQVVHRHEFFSQISW